MIIIVMSKWVVLTAHIMIKYKHGAWRAGTASIRLIEGKSTFRHGFSQKEQDFLFVFSQKQ